MFKKNYDNRNERFCPSSNANSSYGLSAGLLQHIVMISPFGYAITAMDKKDAPIIFVNRSFEEITGYEASEVIGRNCLLLLGEGREQESLLRFQEAVEKGRMYTEVIRNYKKDGSPFYNEIITYPVFDDNGEIIHCVWVIKDVTASAEAERKMARILNETDQRFSAYMNNSKQALWRIDFNPPIRLDDSHADQIEAVFGRGVFTEANDKAASIYGLGIGVNLQGRPLNLHMDDSKPINRAMVASLVQNEFHLEYAITHEKGIDGAEIIAMNNIMPGIKNAEVTHVWGASLEITELFTAQEDLKRSKYELTVKSKALEEKNIALKELVTHIGLEQKEFKERIMTNITEIVLPSLERIKLNKGDETYIDLLRRDLENLASSFGLKMNDIKMKLTPREMEVCNLVKNGLANKDIAKVLKISVHTVEKHRRMARKKLGLNRKNVNLYTYLNSQ